MLEERFTKSISLQKRKKIGELVLANLDRKKMMTSLKQEVKN